MSWINAECWLNEGSVLVPDDYYTVAEHTQVHICRTCEKALRRY